MLNIHCDNALCKYYKPESEKEPEDNINCKLSNIILNQQGQCNNCLTNNYECFGNSGASQKCLDCDTDTFIKCSEATAEKEE
jgi:hypothetical protein